VNVKRRVFAAAALLALASARPAVSQQPVPAQPAPAALDRHFLDATEYFIASDELRWSGEFVAVGRQLAVPSATLRGQTQFEVMGQGSGWQAGDRAWSGQFFRTRVATRSDLTVGKLVFCFNGMEAGAYRGPRDRAEAMNSGWFATTITDVSTLERYDEVKAGRTRLGVSCLRVIQ
jgi:hypothetical protein